MNIGPKTLFHSRELSQARALIDAVIDEVGNIGRIGRDLDAVVASKQELEVADISRCDHQPHFAGERLQRLHERQSRAGEALIKRIYYNVGKSTVHCLLEQRG